MGKRRKSLPAAPGENDDAPLTTVRKVTKKHSQPGEKQIAEREEAAGCKHGTELITVMSEQSESDIDLTEQRIQKLENDKPSFAVNTSQEGDIFQLPLSQNSAGKFVPTFSKPKKLLCRSSYVKHTATESKLEEDGISQNTNLPGSDSNLGTSHRVQLLQSSPQQIVLNITSQGSAEELCRNQHGTEAADENVKLDCNEDIAMGSMQAEQAGCEQQQRHNHTTESSLGEHRVTPREPECSGAEQVNVTISSSQNCPSTAVTEEQTSSDYHVEPQPSPKGGLTGQPELESSGKPLPNTELGPSQSIIYLAENTRGNLASGVDQHWHCEQHSMNQTKDEADSKMLLVDTETVQSPGFPCLDSADGQINTALNLTKEIAPGGSQTQNWVGNESLIAGRDRVLSLTNKGMMDCLDVYQQKEKRKEETRGSIIKDLQWGSDSQSDSLGVNGNVDVWMKQIQIGTSAEKKNGDKTIFPDKTVFSVEDMLSDITVEDFSSQPLTSAQSHTNSQCLTSGQPKADGQSRTSGQLEVSGQPKVNGQSHSSIPPTSTPGDFAKCLQTLAEKQGDISVTQPTSKYETMALCPDNNHQIAVIRETAWCEKPKEHNSVTITVVDDCALSLEDVGPSSTEQENKSTQCMAPESGIQRRNERQPNLPSNLEIEVVCPFTPARLQPGCEVQLIEAREQQAERKEISLIVKPVEDDITFGSELEDQEMSEAALELLSAPAEEEDATAIVCGLINELSKMNRLIMVAHREQERVKRQKQRKGKSAGRYAHTSKAATYSVNRNDL